MERKLFSGTALVVLAVGLTAAVLVALPAFVEPQALRQLMSEEGPVERLSALVWGVAGLYLLLAGARSRFPSGALAVVLLMLALRETGLPPDLVPSGRRLLQARFYLEGPESVWFRAVMAVVLLIGVWAFARTAYWACTTAWRQRTWRSAEGRLLLWAGALLVCGQLAESMADWALLADVMGPLQPLRLVVLGLEEGLECLGSVFVLAAVHFSTLSSPAAQPHPVASPPGWAGGIGHKG